MGNTVICQWGTQVYVKGEHRYISRGNTGISKGKHRYKSAETGLSEWGTQVYVKGEHRYK